MRILHVVRGLANSSGTTHVVIPLAEAQAKLGHQVSVFHVRKPGEQSLHPDEALVESCLFDMAFPTRHPGFSLPFARTMQMQVKECDVVHIHAVWNFVTCWAMLCAAHAGIPYVVAPQGSCDPYAWRMGSWLRRVYARVCELPLLGRASRIQVLTETEKKQVRRMGISAPCATVPNGVRLEFYDRQANVAPLRERLWLPEGEKTLLFLGRLHPKKGLDLLAEAFARVTKQFGDITLVVAGGDRGSGYRLEVEEMFKAMGRKKVRFIGEVRGDQKYRVQLGADAFVLPSYSEGLPVAVIEAMAAKLPVVITQACNLPEVEQCGAGHVADAEPSSIAAGLEEVFREDDLAARMGRRGRRLVEGKFTWEAIARQMISLYGDIC